MTFYSGLLLLCVFIKASAMDFGIDVPLIEAVAGDKAAIPCNVSTPLEDDEASLILWYRVDMPNPIYTLDMRKVPFKNARHFPSTEMGGRAHFNVSVHPPMLVLTPVMEDDEADYKCRVDLRRSRTLILLSRLHIIIPPSEPIIMDEHGQHLHGVIGPYDEGSTLTFICEVDGGNPSPNVTWWRGSFLFDDDFNVTTQGFVRNEVVVRKIQRSDLMTLFTCEASNTQLTKPKAATIQVDINLLPIDTQIVGPKQHILAGEQQEFACETKGSRPRALTTWWLDGKKMGIGNQEGLRDGGNVTVSVLHFTPKPEDNGKVLTCKSANPALPKTTLQDEIVLKVQFLPIINLSLSSSISQSIIREGDNVYLECSLWANPWIHEIKWQFEGRELLGNKTAGVIINNHTLFLRNVSREHRGRYRCLAENAVGEGFSKYKRLNIQFIPVCSSPNPRIYGIAMTESINISCNVEAEPRVLLFRWSINNSVETLHLKNWSNNRIFSFSPIEYSGYGTILCWGQNSIGSQKDPCVIKIVPAGAPESPHDCVVSNQSSHSISVECEAGFNGSLTQTFHMEVYNSVAEHMAGNISKTEKPSFQILDLIPGTSYVLVIYASNVKGKSDSVALVAQTPLPAEKRTAQDQKIGMSVPLFILISVVAIFVAVSTVILCLIRTQVQKQSGTKDKSLPDSAIDCEVPKKELEEGQDASEKGPDIIPLSIEAEVFFTGRLTDESLYGVKQGTSETEYVHQKYTDTVL